MSQVCRICGMKDGAFIHVMSHAIDHHKFEPADDTGGEPKDKKE